MSLNIEIFDQEGTQGRLGSTLCIYPATPSGLSCAWVMRKALKGINADRVTSDLFPEIDRYCGGVVLCEIDSDTDILSHFSGAESVLLLNCFGLSGIVNASGIDNITCLSDNNHSSAVVAWSSLFRGDEPPMLLRYLEDYELNNYEMRDSKAFAAAIEKRPLEFREWDMLVETDPADLIRRGKNILRNKDRLEAERFANEQSCNTAINGQVVPVLHVAASVAVSYERMAGRFLSKHKPFSATYFFSPLGAHFTLYSDRNGENVATLAEDLGDYVPLDSNREHIAEFTVTSLWPGFQVIGDTPALIGIKDWICPKPDKWHELWELLAHGNADGVAPGPPLILAGWWHTSDLDKRNRFIEHMRFATQHGLLQEITKYFRGMQTDDWYYG